MRRKLGVKTFFFGLLLFCTSLSSAFAQVSSSGDQCIANALAGGTADAITIPLLPCSTNTNLLLLTASGANTSVAPTLQQIGGGPALPITKAGGASLSPGDISGAGTIALLTSTGSSWVLLNPATSSPGSAASNLGTLQASPTDARFGAKCDGTTDDTQAFAATQAAVQLIIMPASKTCVVGGLVLGGSQTLDCNGSVLKAAAGAQWVVKLTSYNAKLKNCLVYDPTLTLGHSTTLSGIVAPGATNLPVASVAGFQVGQFVAIQLVSGAYWPTLVAGVNANSIDILDPIPSTLSGTPSVATGGTGYVNGVECVLVGGDGPPTTGTISASGGAITGFSSNSPGLYASAPPAVSAVYCPATSAAYSGTLNVAFGGAGAGAFVDAAWGAILVDGASGGTVENDIVVEAPVALQIRNVGSSSYTFSINNFLANATTLAGIVMGPNVNNFSTVGARVNGFTHRGSSYGVVGLFVDGTGQTQPSGGNKWDVLTLGYENGGFEINAVLQVYTNAVFDTIRNYGYVKIGGGDAIIDEMCVTFTGPNAVNGAAGKGVGAYFGNGTQNNTLSALCSKYNATDLHLGDSVSSLWVSGSGWGNSKLLTGSAYSLYSSEPLVTFPTLSVSGAASPEYLVPGTASTTQTVGVPTGLRGNITKVYGSTSSTPDAGTYVLALQVSRYSAFSHVVSATVAAGGASGTPGACTATVSGGTGTSAQVSGTVNGGGALAGALTIANAGGYSAGPSGAGAAIVGCGLVGATVNLVQSNYGSWSQVASCEYTAGLTGCLMGTPVPIFPEDLVELILAIQGGGSFPAGTTFTGYVDGL